MRRMLYLKAIPSGWAASSVGRAPRSQRGGRGFESHAVHQSLSSMNIDERIEALTMHLELLSQDNEGQRKKIEDLLKIAERDGENIRALARIAEIHERRLTSLEGGSEGI